jgi:hypothetical protein
VSLTGVVGTDAGLVSIGVSVVVSVLGFVVGAIAYRGYRRNASLPMLFTAAGFLFAFWMPGALAVGFLALDATVTFAPGLRSTVGTALGFASQVCRIVGLLCLLYGLWMPFEDG